ncbi:dihydroneopterin aldolase [Bacillus timonensis]|nr:dihydroneopterin aldolase [Bacillus timonensis]
MNSDKILLTKMDFYGYHGVYKEENKLGQRFTVDLTVQCDLSDAGNTDDLTKTINYADLYQVCRDIVEGEPYRLVETVAEKIAANILSEFDRVNMCTVKVIKPDPPIPGYYQSVAVEITRRR